MWKYENFPYSKDTNVICNYNYHKLLEIWLIWQDTSKILQVSNTKLDTVKLQTIKWKRIVFDQTYFPNAQTYGLEERSNITLKRRWFLREVILPNELLFLLNDKNKEPSGFFKVEWNLSNEANATAKRKKRTELFRRRKLQRPRV